MEELVQQRGISRLPDRLMLRILLSMPAKDVIKFCSLSRHWYRGWTRIDSIDFHESLQTSSDLRRFIFFVNRLLEIYPSDYELKRFSLHLGLFRHKDSVQGTVDQWIRFAVEHGVEELSLDLESYELPELLWSYDSLESLHITGCAFPKDPELCEWTSLKKLSLSQMEFDNYVKFKNMLYNLEELEFLKLEGCQGPEEIKLDSSSSLRELVVDSHDCYYGVEIEARNLHVLCLQGYWRCKKLKLRKTSSVVEAEMDFQLQGTDLDDSYYSWPPQVFCGTIKAILHKLRHVPKLHIGYWCNEVISSMEEEGVGLQEFAARCKHLRIDSALDRIDLLGIATFLDVSHQVEKLELRRLCRDTDYEFDPRKREPGHDKLDKSPNIFWSLEKYLERVKTIVLRWPDVATGRATTRAFNLSNGPEELARFMACKFDRTSKLATGEIGGGEDHISLLPDHLMLHIFSFMPTKDVIKVCSLSRKWRRSWTLVENIDFNESLRTNSELHRFIFFMDNFLKSYPSGYKLKRFSLRLGHSCSNLQAIIDRWIRYGIEHGVEDLSLDLKSYELPQFTSLNSAFPNPCRLKKLSISHMKMSNAALSSILYGIHTLELLKLEDCWGLSKIEVFGLRRLRELVIDSQVVYRGILEIKAPNLRVLRLRGYWKCQGLKLTQVCSLVEAELDFLMQVYDDEKFRYYFPPPDFFCSTIKQILEELHYVPNLRIGYWCNEVLSSMSKAGLDLQGIFIRSKHLRIDSMLNRADLLGITTLLDVVHQVDKLELRKLRRDIDYELDPRKRGRGHAIPDDRDELRQSPNDIFQSLEKYLRHLKTFVLRWSDAVTGREMMRAFDLTNGLDELARFIA